MQTKQAKQTKQTDGTPQISFRQYAACVALFVMGSTLITSGDRSAGYDTWLVVLAALAASLLFSCVYVRILRLFPGKSLYQILRLVFGKYVGTALSALLVVYYLHLAGLVLADFVTYTHSVSLPNTPMLLLLLPLALLCLYLAQKGIQVIGRVAVLLLALLLVVLVVNSIFSVPYLHFDFFRPVLHHTPSAFAQGFVGLFAFPFGETVAFLPVLPQLKPEENKRKAFAVGLCIGGGILTLLALRNVLMLGELAYTKAYFPTHVALAILEIGQYLQRVEALASYTMLFCIFIKATICLYGAQLALSELPRHPKWALAAAFLPFLLFAMWLFPTPQAIVSFARNLYSRYAIPIQTALPVCVWIVAEWRCRRRAAKAKP